MSDDIERPPVKRRRWPEERIGEIARAQRTLITHAQALECGATRRSLERALARTRLYVVYRGLFSTTPPSLRPPLWREQAALLACGPDAVLSHRTAAALHGLLPPAESRDVDVTTSVHQRGRTLDGIRVHRPRDLPADVVCRRRVLPATIVPRTIIDLAADPRTADRELERAFDFAIRRHMTSRTQIAERLERQPRRRGAKRLRALLAPGRPTTFTRSEAEERMLALCRRAHVPEPETNFPFEGYELDFFWPERRVAVEVDGYDFHSDRPVFHSDRRRDNELRRLGITVVHVTWDQLVGEPELVLTWIVTALARAV